MMKCTECPDYRECSKTKDLRRYRQKCPKAKQEKVFTIADRIRAMKDDELRNFLCGLMTCDRCNFGASDGCKLKDWLQTPSKEGDHEAEP